MVSFICYSLCSIQFSPTSWLIFQYLPTYGLLFVTYSSAGFDRPKEICIYCNYLTEQFHQNKNSLVQLPDSQTLPLPQPLNNHWYVFFPKSFDSSRKSYKWNHTVCRFMGLAAYTYQNAFKNHAYCCMN